MRLFPGVCPGMYSQGASLDEGLATAVEIAPVWPVVRVYPVMPLEIGFPVEPLVRLGQLPGGVTASKEWPAQGREYAPCHRISSRT